MLAFLEATSAVVKEGDDAPKFVGVDIHGRPLDTSASKDEQVKTTQMKIAPTRSVVDRPCEAFALGLGGVRVQLF